jgi:DNA-binding NarL/FixJ family response regulator
MALAQLDLRRPERAPVAVVARVRTRDDRSRIGSRCAALVKLPVVILDDRPLTGQMVQAALRRHGIAAELTTIADEVEKRAGSGAAVTAVVPVRAGEGAHTAAIMRRIIEAGGRVIGLADGADRLDLAACLEAGAAGITSGSSSLLDLVSAIRRVAAGLSVVSERERVDSIIELRERRRSEHARQAPFATLSPRECDVLRQIAAGNTAATIAENSFVSLATVRSQIRSILQKLDVNSQVAAVALARSAGWA